MYSKGKMICNLLAIQFERGAKWMYLTYSHEFTSIHLNATFPHFCLRPAITVTLPSFAQTALIGSYLQATVPADMNPARDNWQVWEILTDAGEVCDIISNRFL